MIIHDPNLIEQRSMEIIESELTVPVPEENKAVVKRVIHATADFDYARNLAFSEGAVEKALAALREGSAARSTASCQIPTSPRLRRRTALPAPLRRWRRRRALQSR